MKLPLDIKGIIYGITAGLAAIGLAFAMGKMIRPKVAANSGGTQRPVVRAPASGLTPGAKLFLNNCAHCHGVDARGDEGPNLHDVAKSDARVAALIKNGIRGEMPKFGEKLSPTEIQALVAYVRALR